MRVLIVAGGTGGGIYPALSAATELQNMGLAANDIRWIGTAGEMEEKLVPRAGLQLETIAGGGMVGVAPHVMLKNGAKLLASLSKSSRIIREFQPDVMFMTGGYMAAPVTLACRWHKVPICIYLPDVEPGKSIRFSVRFADKIAATTSGSKQFVPEEKMVVTGYPVRPEIRAACNLSKEEALAQFDLTNERPTLFVFGGSRGALAINDALMGILPELLQTLQVIHISGTFTWPKVETNLANIPEALRRYYRAYPYLHEEMGAGFRAADLVLARAGASMLGESPAFGLPSIMVPLTFAWRYQKVNADYLSDHGAAIQLTDEQLPNIMLPTILDLFNNKERLNKMQTAAKALDLPNGALNLAQLIVDTAEGAKQ
ncbi:MAG: UDP-N-acetylglucosamine--N-acetylmuramyl-(pentapeptide) pyrophosphoryl-undecaprenol N-acetylglucosamine transferase [Chloroflexi bacterium]|nr:MAG: UDP-N-acetylglucosamine--N-acetylmuramyl-(pentapeptide) pyrophosphoryl-undecaprenol N-acetylglucosamine transferase [Chloroflexota bacterium]